MTVSPRLRVVVDIQRTASTVSGQISVAGAAPTEFFGWLELIDGLEGAAAQQGDPSYEPSDGGSDVSVV
jgi:hypothetical protein